MSDVHIRIRAIEDERAEAMANFDARIAALKDEAAQELLAAKARVAALESALGVTHRPVRPVREPTALDETDAGNGIGPARESGDSLLDDLAEVRRRTAEKRKRLA